MAREAEARWTPTALLLLGFLVALAASEPAAGGTNETSLERRWESLFSRSVLGISGERAELNWESDYLLGIKRVRRLYCNVGIGFHLQVLPDGRINGAHNENQYSEFHAEKKMQRSKMTHGPAPVYEVSPALWLCYACYHSG